MSLDSPFENFRELVGEISFLPCWGGFESNVPVRTNGILTITPLKIVSGRELINPLEHCLRPGDPQKCQIPVNGTQVYLPGHPRHGQDRLDLGSKNQAIIQLRIVKRLDAEPIARQQQLTGVFPQIQYREREHSVQPVQQLEAPLFVPMNEYLGICMRAETMAFCFQLSSQRRKVINLAVVADPHAAILITHGHVARRCEVNDAEPAIPQSKFPVRRDESPVVVWSSMRNEVHHPLKQALIGKSRCSADSAHFAV